MDILGIGNAIVDVLVKAEDAFLQDRGLEKGTMRLINQKEAERLYDEMGPSLEMSGGSAANTMAAFSALGGKAGFLGIVCQDQLGEVFIHDLKACGVSFYGSPKKESLPTARCFVIVTPDGERTMNTFLGASVSLGPDDVQENVVKSARFLYLEGYLFDPEKAKEAFFKALELARRGGSKIALSLSDVFCVERHRDDFLRLIGDQDNGIDLLFANEAELKALYQTDNFEEAISRAQGVCELAAITRSSLGSVLLTRDERIHIPAHFVEKVVDTTGAGDLYAAGFLRGLTDGKNLSECGRLGARAAAHIIGQVGARFMDVGQIGL